MSTSGESRSARGGPLTVPGPTNGSGCSSIPWLYLGTVALCLFALLVTISASLKPPLHDETYYLATVSLFDEYGVSRTFLRALPGPAGPTYTFVQALARPFTGLELRGARLVNFCLLLATSLVLPLAIRTLRARGDPDLAPSPQAWYGGLDAIAVPMTWVMAGTALTEMPGILFASLSLLALAACTESPLRRAWLPSVIGGLCLGLALLARQTLLPLLAMTPILAVRRKGNLPALALFCLLATTEIAVAFEAWRGLSPPLTKYVGSGLAPGHGVKALACAGSVMFLLAPGFFRMPLPLGLLVVVVAVLVNAFLGVIQLGPMQAAAEQLLSVGMKTSYDAVSSALAVAIAALYLAACAVNLIRHRSNRFYLLLLLSSLAVVLTSVKVTHLFSSRYVGQALPMLVLLGAYHSHPCPGKAARVVVGSLVGAAMLWACV